MRSVALNVQRRRAALAEDIADCALESSPDVVALTELPHGEARRRILDLLAAGGLAHSAVGLPSAARTPWCAALASRTPIEQVAFALLGTPRADRLLEAVVAGVTVAVAYFPLDAAHVPFRAVDFLPWAAELAGRDAVILGDWNTDSTRGDIGGRRVDGMREFDAFLDTGWVDA